MQGPMGQPMGQPMHGPGSQGVRAEGLSGAAESLETWLELRERLIRALEAENQELRRQLEALRRGVGIAVVIEGQTITLAPVPIATDPRVPAAPSDTRPEAARHPRTGWQTGAGMEIPAVPPTMPARSGYAFAQPWPGGGPLPPTPSPAWGGGAGSGLHPNHSPMHGRGEPEAPSFNAAAPPQPVPSLPSMPTSQLPAMPPPAPSHSAGHSASHSASQRAGYGASQRAGYGANQRAAMPGAPRTGAADDSWLTDQVPVPPARSGSQPQPTPNMPPAGPRPRPASHALGEDAAWLRTGAPWPDTTPRNPVPSQRPAFPPAPAAIPPQQRPVRAPRTTREDVAPGERNIYADSFIV